MTGANISRIKGDVAIVIPALNEAVSIARVVTEASVFGSCIVVDDGSIDATAAIAEKNGALVVRSEKNQGYDVALSIGLFKAIELGFDFAITIDADGQHPIKALEVVSSKLKLGADLVLGVRTRYQRISEVIFSLVSKLLWRIPDPLCGLKGYKLQVLSSRGVFDSYSSIGTEFVLWGANSDLDIQFVSIETEKRRGLSVFGSGVRPNIKILRSLIIGVGKFCFLKKRVVSRS